MSRLRTIFSLAMILTIMALVLAACGQRGETTTGGADAGVPVVTVYKSPT